MKCKSCKMPFGINFDLGYENEKIGNCVLCDNDICHSCACARIETQSDIDPGGYINVCASCINKLAISSKEDVAA